MISSGMTILRALYTLEAQTENKLLAEIIADVRKDVEAGLPLSSAFERHPKVFTPLFVAMARAGETGGVLEESLLRVADQLEKEDSLRRQIKSAMVYPGVIMSFALIVLVALVTFLVPVFVGVFDQFGGDLPTITKFTVALSNAMKGQWWAFIGVSVGGAWGFRKFRRSEWGRPKWDAFRLRVPMKIGDIVQKVALARWSRTLSALVAAGVPLLAALDITAKTAGNHVVEKAMAEVIESVRRGDRRPGHDALQDRRLLRGPGRRLRQVPDLDPRADHARRRRRHRRVHRHLDVPAALQGLRPDQVGPRRGGRRRPAPSTLL
jgi:type IV pilus assembly protein PilC